jgi:hypothetical protein
VPIQGRLIGILCVNSRLNCKGRKVLYVIALHRILLDTLIFTHNATTKKVEDFSRSTGIKVVSFVPTAVYRSYSSAHPCIQANFLFTQNHLINTILLKFHHETSKSSRNRHFP